MLRVMLASFEGGDITLHVHVASLSLIVVTAFVVCALLYNCMSLCLFVEELLASAILALILAQSGSRFLCNTIVT